MPYLGLFIIARDRPFSRKVNKITLIYSILLSFIILIKITYDVFFYGGIFYRILFISILICLYILRDNIKENIYIRKIKAVLSENYIEDEIILTKREEEEALGEIIKDFELRDKLTNYIRLETRRYDNGDISLDEYDNTLNILVDEFFKVEGFTEALKEKNIRLDNVIMESYIRVVKKEIYSEIMKNELDVSEREFSEIILRKYTKYYGLNSLKEINIKTLAVILDVDVEVAKEYVQEEFKRVRSMEQEF